MKKTIQSFINYVLPMAIVGILSTGCETTDTYIETASVAIEQTGEFIPTECTIVFTPSTTTARFEYAIGTEADRAKFENGTLESIKQQAGNMKATVKFDELKLGEVYTIFARAYAGDISGPVSSFVPKMNIDGYLIQPRFIADRSAEFNITCTSDFYRFRVAIGKPSDRAAFESGTLEAVDMEEETCRSMAYYDLGPNTDYVFFAQGYDRSDHKTTVIETPFTTFKDSMGADPTCPGVSMKIDDINIYEGHYTFTANSLCGTIAIAICQQGLWNEILNNEMNWKGDVLAMFSSWYTFGSQSIIAAGEKSVKATFQTPELILENHLEAYVLIFNKNEEPVSISRFRFTTPAEDTNAEKATATVEVTDITAAGATYTLAGGDATFAYMFDSVGADWYDEFKKTDDYTENYLGNLLFANGKYWNFGNTSVTWTETSCKPNTRYYAAIIPMNTNGPMAGWGEEVLVEYITLPAPEE